MHGKGMKRIQRKSVYMWSERMNSKNDNVNIEKDRDGRRIFWLGYACYVVVIAILIVFALNKVSDVLVEYEAKQPERTISAAVNEISKVAKTGSLWNVIEYPDTEQNYLDSVFSEISEYEDKLKNASEFTYEILSGGYSDSGQSYSILADGEQVAVLNIESAGEEKKLAILNVTDWRVKNIIPVLSYTSYDYTVEVPEGFVVYVNGVELAEGAGVTKAAGSTPDITVYTITGLHSEPQFSAVNGKGENVRYSISNNCVSLAAYVYDLELPAGFKVYAAGKAVSASEGADGKYNFAFASPYSELVIEDSFGHRLAYSYGAPIRTYDYRLTVPDNFKVEMSDGTDSSQYVSETGSNVKYQYCSDYADMPSLVTYIFSASFEAPQICVTDNLGNVTAVDLSNGSCSITDQTGVDSLPESVAAEVDPIDLAKKWSLFVTDDLEGSEHGFSTLRKMLIPDSYLWKEAYKYLNSIDITFISSHTMSNPPFGEERLSNVVFYSDTCFSCDVHFRKDMDLIRTGAHITDVTNSTIYYVKYDGAWRIVDMQEKVNE